MKTVEQARELLMTDPAIKAKYLRAEAYPWYGSAALSRYLEASDKVWKKNLKTIGISRTQANYFNSG